MTLNIIHLPSEIINEICEFLATNTELSNVRALCKEMKKDMDWYGFIRDISLSFSANAMNFVMLKQFNLRALRYLSMERLVSPQHWVTCEWPETTMFRLCHIEDPLIPPPGSRTTSLHLVDITTKKRKLQVDWGKLKYLKKVYIATDYIDLSGLENCENLETVILDLRVPNSVPEILFSLPKLRVIISNVGPAEEKEIQVVSTVLEKCMMPKKMKFICQSKVVPKRHITDNISINVRSIVGNYM